MEAGEIISFYYAPVWVMRGNERNSWIRGARPKLWPFTAKGSSNYIWKIIMCISSSRTRIHSIDELCVVQKKMNKQKEPVSINFESIWNDRNRKELAGIGCSKPLSHFLLIDSSLKDSDPSQMDRIGRLRKEIDEVWYLSKYESYL